MGIGKQDLVLENISTHTNFTKLLATPTPSTITSAHFAKANFTPTPSTPNQPFTFSMSVPSPSTPPTPLPASPRPPSQLPDYISRLPPDFDVLNCDYELKPCHEPRRCVGCKFEKMSLVCEECDLVTCFDCHRGIMTGEDTHRRLHFFGRRREKKV